MHRRSIFYCPIMLSGINYPDSSLHPMTFVVTWKFYIKVFRQLWGDMSIYTHTRIYQLSKRSSRQKLVSLFCKRRRHLYQRMEPTRGQVESTHLFGVYVDVAGLGVVDGRCSIVFHEVAHAHLLGFVDHIFVHFSIEVVGGRCR